MLATTRKLLIAITMISLFFAPLAACGDDEEVDDDANSADGDDEISLEHLPEEHCDRQMECSDDYDDDDYEACIEFYPSSPPESIPDQEYEDADEDKCQEAGRDFDACRVELSCDEFDLDYEHCSDEYDAIDEYCAPNMMWPDHGDQDLHLAICDKAYECYDSFDDWAYQLCVDEADCEAFRQRYYDCRMGLSCEESSDPTDVFHECFQEMLDLSAACRDTEVEPAPELVEDLCDRRLECEDGFTEDDHAICLEAPNCDETKLMVHECEMELTCDDFLDRMKRSESCFDVGTIPGTCELM